MEALIPLILGAILPPVIDVVNKYVPNSNIRFLVSVLFAVVVGGIMAYAEFGMEGFLRLSYNTSIKDITEGVERIKWALDPNSPNELYIGERKLVRDWV